MTGPGGGDSEMDEARRLASLIGMDPASSELLVPLFHSTIAARQLAEAQRLFDRDPAAADRLVSAVVPSVAELKAKRDAAWQALNAAVDDDSVDVDTYVDLFDEWHSAADEYADAVGKDRPVPEGRT